MLWGIVDGLVSVMIFLMLFLQFYFLWTYRQLRKVGHRACLVLFFCKLSTVWSSLIVSVLPPLFTYWGGGRGGGKVSMLGETESCWGRGGAWRSGGGRTMWVEEEREKGGGRESYSLLSPKSSDTNKDPTLNPLGSVRFQPPSLTLTHLDCVVAQREILKEGEKRE